MRPCSFSCFFFFNDTATTEIYTLSLHDALPDSRSSWAPRASSCTFPPDPSTRDRKSTRLNSSHQIISYAVFCLKKKKQPTLNPVPTTDISSCPLCNGGRTEN